MGAEVVVTGIGLITSLGADRASTWTSVRAGQRGLAPLRLFELAGREPPVVAAVASFPRRKGIAKRALRGSARTDRMALAAALEAVEDAQLEPPRSSAPP
jgi:3-oxoacyl-[acyl-carrier-protein] synthase II